MGYKSKFSGAEVDDKLSRVVAIVDDESKLAELDIPVGAIASVAANSIEETSIRDLFQPDESLIDQTNGALTAPEKLSGISSLAFTLPPEGAALVQAGFYIIPRTFSMSDQRIIMISVEAAGVAAMGIGVDLGTATYQPLPLVYLTGDTPGLNQANIETLNKVLASDDFCYFSLPDTGYVITSEQFDTLDMVVKVVAGVVKEDCYMKGFDGFAKLAKRSYIDKELTTLKKVLDKKADAFSIEYGSWTYKQLAPNTIYINMSSSVRDLSVAFALSIIDTAEYVVYFNNVSSLTLSSSVLWANGEVPNIDPAMSYELNIVHVKDESGSKTYRAICVPFKVAE